MKVKEDRTNKFEVTVAIICDMCGAKGGFDGWGKTPFDVNEMTIECERGERYPEGGYIETTSVDLCPVCFDKAIAWLRSKGCEINTSEVDF